MSFYEVDRKKLNQKDKSIIYRFLQDLNKKINLFIWQHEDQKPEQSFGIEKFQFSYRSHILEWKESSTLKYGVVDEGYNYNGIKRSPIMLLQEEVDQKALDILLRYVQNHDKDELKELVFIEKILEEKVTI